MNICGFIFDLDGVLTDTAEYHFRAWKRLADEIGIPFDRQENEALRGIPRRESLLRLLQGCSYAEGQLQELMERKNNYYIEYIGQVTPSDLLPSAREFLLEVRAAGLKTAVGSASKNARLVIDRLGITHLFDTIADGHSVKRQKPAPDLFLFAARQISLKPTECVVVEDAAAGIEAALAGGFRTLGIGPASRVGAAEIILNGLHEAHLADLLARYARSAPAIESNALPSKPTADVTG